MQLIRKRSNLHNRSIVIVKKNYRNKKKIAWSWLIMMSEHILVIHVQGGDNKWTSLLSVQIVIFENQMLWIC